MDINAAENFPVITKSPAVAVVILNWNGKDFLKKFLPAVIASSFSNKKIIVADNASTDDSLQFLRDSFPKVEVIINPKNEGFAGGYNAALKKVVADYYVLLNSDIEVTPGWIEPIIELMERDRTIGACQPKILDYKNRAFFEYAGACGGWIDELGYPFARGRVLEQMEKDTGQYDEVSPCFWASGAALFVRSSVYHELGGFDGYFFAHQEEIDLCWRMQRSGYKIFVQPASVVYHVGGGTLPKGNSKKTYLNFRNNMIMLYKNTPAAALFLKLPARVFLDIVSAVKALLSGDRGYFLSVAKAHKDFVKWFLFEKRKSLFVKTTNKNITGRYSGSILWQYYFRRKRKFSEFVGSK